MPDPKICERCRVSVNLIKLSLAGMTEWYCPAKGIYEIYTIVCRDAAPIKGCYYLFEQLIALTEAAGKKDARS